MAEHQQNDDVTSRDEQGSSAKNNQQGQQGENPRETEKIEKEKQRNRA